jgi:hypothetical protein
MDGKGHPLPASDEARYDEIPERDERDKGLGDEDREAVQPANEAGAPDGERHPIDHGGHEVPEATNEVEADRR